MRGSHHRAALAFWGCAVVGCVEGQAYQWPEVDADLALLYADAGEGALRPLGSALTRGPDGAWSLVGAGPTVQASNEKLVAFFVEAASLRKIHPLVDLDALAEIKALPPVLECPEGLSADGRAEAPVPEDAIVYESIDGELRPPKDAAGILERAGRLSLPLSKRRCESGFVAQRFGADWSVLAETLTVGEDSFSRSREIDRRAFRITAASYLDADRVLITMSHGLAVVERGALLSDDLGPHYFSSARFPESGAMIYGFSAVAVLPDPPQPGVQRVVASILASDAVIFTTRMATFDIDEAGIRLVQSASVGGELDRLRVDADGRAIGIIGGSGSGEFDRRLILGYRSGVGFDRWMLPLALRYFDVTGTSNPKHVALTSDGKLIAGDLADPVSYTTVAGAEEGVIFQRGISVTREKGQVSIFLGHDGGQLRRFWLDGSSASVPVYLDETVKASGCRSAQSPCGYSGLGASASRLWATEDAEGAIVAVTPTKCLHAVGARAEVGCFELLDVGQVPLTNGQDSAIAGIYPNQRGDRALVVGDSGTLFELVVANPAP